MTATTTTFGSLVDLALQRASSRPDLELYTFLDRGETPGEVMTPAELAARARRIAGNLQELTGPGGRVVLVLPNRLDFVVAFLGCLFAGAVAVPALIPRAGRFVSRFLKVVRAADTRLVLTNSATLEGIRALAVEHPEVLQLEWLAIESLADAPWRMPDLNRESLAFLQFTSGSTGDPKGVMVSHGNLLHNLRLLESGLDPGPDSKIVSWLPFFHDWGLIGGLLQPLYLGIPGVIMDPLDFLAKPLRWIRAISRFRATISGAPNFAYDLCARQPADDGAADLDLSAWDTAIVAAEPVRAGTLEQFSARFAAAGFRRSAFYPSYGLAESTLVVTGVRKGEGPSLLTLDRAALERDGQAVEAATGANGDTQTHVGCGSPLLDLKVAIARPGTGVQCGDGEVGEIWVSGPSVTGGYWQDPQTTAQTFGACLEDGKGPFLRTGDLGFLRAGQLFVTGRSKDLIILAGRNLYPQDIELTVERSHPALRPGCTAAFSVDGDGRERLVLVQEIAFGPRPDLQQVIGAIQKTVASGDGIFADVIALVEPGSIPKTSSGKIRRKDCRELYLAKQLRSLAVWENGGNGHGA